MKKQRVYWLVPHKTPKHIGIINALAKRHFAIHSLLDFDDLVAEFERQRAAIVIIDNHQGAKDLAGELKKIVHLPAFYGVRFIFSFQQSNHSLTRFLTKLGFRDALPLDLAIDDWIERFMFSTATQKRPLKQPLPQMTLENIAALSIPARLTYMDTKYLRIESRILLKEGQKIRLTGKFASELGVKSLTLTVLKRYQTNVHFRYSDGYVMSWQASHADVNKVNLVFSDLKNQAIEDPMRVFAAIHNASLRKRLADTLLYPEFELAIALQKRSLQQEPRFFNPDAIVIEAQIPDLYGLESLSEMLETIHVTTPIYILGANADREVLDHLAHKNNRDFIYLEDIPSNFAQYLNRKIQRQHSNEQIGSGYHISHNHRFSYGELRFPGRLTRIHPEVAQIASPFRIGSYALCALETPLLKKTLHRGIVVKVTNTYKHDNQDLASFPELIDCSFCDINKAERQKIARHLSEIFREHLLQPEPEDALDTDARRQSEEVVDSLGSDDEKQDELSVPEIKIDRAHGMYKSYHNSFWVKYGREMQILFATVVLMGLLYLVIAVLRKPPTEQGKVFSDSIRKYYEAVNPHRKTEDSEQEK